MRSSLYSSCHLPPLLLSLHICLVYLFNFFVLPNFPHVFQVVFKSGHSTHSVQESALDMLLSDRDGIGRAEEWLSIVWNTVGGGGEEDDWASYHSLLLALCRIMMVIFCPLKNNCSLFSLFSQICWLNRQEVAECCCRKSFEGLCSESGAYFRKHRAWGRECPGECASPSIVRIKPHCTLGVRPQDYTVTSVMWKCRLYCQLSQVSLLIMCILACRVGVGYYVLPLPWGITSAVKCSCISSSKMPHGQYGHWPPKFGLA